MLWNIDQIVNLNEVTFACDWLSDYLRTNVDSDESVHSLCRK